MCAMPEATPQHHRREVMSAIARQALNFYHLSDAAQLHLLNQSENTTYLVEDPQTNRKMILRLNRPDYHTREELEAELVWIHSIRQHTSIIVPEVIPSQRGEWVQEFSTPLHGSSILHCTMFSFLTGSAPDESNPDGLVKYFRELGQVTARLHQHTRNWGTAHPLNRPTWDHDTMLGERARWGRWQDGLNVTTSQVALFQQVSETIQTRLHMFGRSPERFGLIHADLRLANLLVEKGQIKVLDFDDCGYSWFLYDLAAGLSFIEHQDSVPELIDSWLSGYEAIRRLPDEDKLEIPTFIMLRRLMLLAWIGSHADSDTVQTIDPEFTHKTEQLARKYLEHHAV